MTNLPTAERIGTLTGRIGFSGLNALTDNAQISKTNPLLFSLSNLESGTELGVSDGTPEGGGLLLDIFPGSQSSGSQSPGSQSPGSQSANSASPDRFTRFKTALFFQARSPLGSDVWFTDGTAEGTQILTDLVPGSQLVVTSPLEVVGDRLLFETYQPETAQRLLWASDGTPNGTEIISNPENRVFNFGSTNARLNNQFLFSSFGRELWATDGSRAGTQLLQELAVARMLPVTLPVGERVFMEASDRTRGYELWVTDGTVPGTRIVTDLRPGITSSAPNLLQAFKGEVYFTAKGLQGEQLWASDGTEAGTRKVKEISPLSGLISQVSTMVNDRLLFVTRTPATGMELWSTDGSEAGTQLVRDINPGPSSSLINQMIRLGDRVVFSATSSDGSEPWVSDGTTTGTVQLKDIYAGSSPSGFYPLIWPSPGRPSGAPLPLEPMMRPNGSAPQDFTLVGEEIYFTATRDGTSRDLWRTDGSVEGTRLAASALELGGSRIENLTRLGDDLVFSIHLPDENASQIWRLSRGAIATERSKIPVPEIPVPEMPIPEMPMPGISMLTNGTGLGGLELIDSGVITIG